MPDIDPSYLQAARKSLKKAGSLLSNAKYRKGVEAKAKESGGENE
jgi:hypothetical protein